MALLVFPGRTNRAVKLLAALLIVVQLVQLVWVHTLSHIYGIGVLSLLAEPAAVPGRSDAVFVFATPCAF